MGHDRPPEVGSIVYKCDMSVLAKYEWLGFDIWTCGGEFLFAQESPNVSLSDLKLRLGSVSDYPLGHPVDVAIFIFLYPRSCF